MLSGSEYGAGDVRRSINDITFPHGEAPDIIVCQGFISPDYLVATDDEPGNIVQFPYLNCLYDDL